MLFWMRVNGVKWTVQPATSVLSECVSLGIWTGSRNEQVGYMNRFSWPHVSLSVSVTAYVVWASVIIQGVNRCHAFVCVYICTCRSCACRCTSFFLGTTCAWKICRSEKWGSSSSIGWDQFFSVFTAAMLTEEKWQRYVDWIIGCILIVVLMHSFTAHCHRHPLFYPSVTNNAWIRNWDTSDFLMLVVCNREWHINIQKAFLPPCHG